MSVDTLPLPVQRVKRRRHPVRNTLIVLLVLAVLAVVALVVGDGIFRGYAEGQIDKDVQQSLPAGVTGTVHSTIGGGSAIEQWLHGSFDDVHLVSNDLRIGGGAAKADLRVHGLPVDGSGTVRSATGSLTISQGALKDLAPLQAADAAAPTLGDGSVATSVQRTVLGVPLTVDVTLVPSVRGKYVHLAPTKATLKSGPISVPGTTLIRTLLPDGISVCAAKYLPPTVRLTSIDVREGSATVGLVADHLDLNALQKGATGSC
ncbi:MAG: LmeA family phospholipid-binding protein [Amnibacterium sp.]